MDCIVDGYYCVCDENGIKIGLCLGKEKRERVGIVLR